MLANADPASRPARFTALVGGLHDGPARIAQGDPQTGAAAAADLARAPGRCSGCRPASSPATPSTSPRCSAATRHALLDRLAAAAGLGGAVRPARRRAHARWPRAGAGERGVRPEVGYAWDRLAETGGNLRIDDLAREVGWSRRHLAEQFRAETGLAPEGGRPGDPVRAGLRPAAAPRTGPPLARWPPTPATSTRPTSPATSATSPASPRPRGSRSAPAAERCGPPHTPSRHRAHAPPGVRPPADVCRRADMPGAATPRPRRGPGRRRRGSARARRPARPA